MDIYLQVIILAFIQGVTEFLPVSSSAHLVVLPKLAGWQEFGLSFDIALHLGSLVAVLSYFRVEIRAMLIDGAKYLFGGQFTANVALIYQLILGTGPLVLLTIVLKDKIEIYLHSIHVIAISTIIFGLLLYASDLYGRRMKQQITQLSYKAAFLIGVAEMLTLIPGVSRSGITLSAGLALGIKRLEAAKFSFLLSIPAILGAGVFSGYKLLSSHIHYDGGILALGFIVSTIVSYISIHFFLRLLERVGVLPFVIYRLVLGLALLVIKV